MSQSKSSGKSSVAAHFWKPCALLIDDHLIGGTGLGVDSYIDTTIQIHRETDAPSVMGFSISIPFGASNEDDGFGVCHSANRQKGTIPPADSYKLVVKFPTVPKPNFTVKLADNSLQKLIPATDKKLSSLVVRLADFPEVDGFGMPFANRGHPSEGVVNRGECIQGNITLINMIRRLEFNFIVSSPDIPLFKQLDAGLPAPFRYPYGEEHFWDEGRYDEVLPKTKGHQFKPSWSFDNDNELLAALTQSQVQDVYWVYKASKQIAATKFRAYFINPLNCLDSDCMLFHVIVPLQKEFLLQYEDAWRVLTKSQFLTLYLYEDEKDNDPAKWDARIQEASKTLDVLRDHPVDSNDLVLHVRRPKSSQKARHPEFKVKVFEERILANAALKEGKDNWTCVSIDFEDLVKDYIRKVDAVNCFRPGAQPTNPIASGIPKDMVVAAEKANRRLAIPPNLQLRMSLHRDVLRGNGFSKTLRSGIIDTAENEDDALTKLSELELNDGEATLPSEMTQLLCRLPVVNFIDFDQDRLAALLEFVLEEDRPRFVAYFSRRHLGIAIITAPPGFGKTTALAVAALAMQSTLGKILASAPTNVATDNFAERLDGIAQKVTIRLNEGKSGEDPTRARSPLILRCYNRDEEADAFINILRNSKLGDNAGPNNNWRRESKWRLHLSPTYWLLIVLRSPVVRSLGGNDPLFLHEMQKRMDSMDINARLRAVATQKMTWQEYQQGGAIHPRVVEKMFKDILNAADIICTTPAVSCQQPFKGWKEEKARGIAVDEAGAMSRPDALSVWGNTLTPTAFSGDDDQLPAPVMTDDIKDDEGNYLNRLALEGKISPLGFLKATGWPVYRLRVQLRMGNGLFDICHQEVYSDLPFHYGLKSSIANHKIGQTLEDYLRKRFQELKPTRADVLQEVFVHCPGTVCLIDPVTKSKRNQEQVNRALKLLSDLVKKTDIPASSIGVISPYKANVELFERCRKDSQYSAPLLDMPAAATVDSFQGREADIMVVILGTTKEVGPGFTVNKNRLNVMLSRQKSGLLVFGDLNVLGKVNEQRDLQVAGGRGRGQGKGQGNGQGKQRTLVTLGSATHFVKRGMMANALQHWSDAGRVVTMDK